MGYVWFRYGSKPIVVEPLWRAYDFETWSFGHNYKTMKWFGIKFNLWLVFVMVETLVKHFGVAWNLDWLFFFGWSCVLSNSCGPKPNGKSLKKDLAYLIVFRRLILDLPDLYAATHLFFFWRVANRHNTVYHHDTPRIWYFISSKL